MSVRPVFRGCLPLLAAAGLVVPALAAAQPATLRLVPLPAEVQACSAAVEGGRADEAHRLGAAAVETLRGGLAATPADADAHVALATTLLRCRLPLAGEVARGELAGEAVELLRRALELEPGHWTARFALASTYARLPAFMGRFPDAVREADALLAHQGTRAQPAVLARAWELRGDLWARARRPDSAVAVWQRGAALFPADSGLARRLHEAPATPPATLPATPPTTPPSAGRTAPLGAVRVVAVRAPAVGPAAPGVVALGRAQVQTTPGAMADVFHAVNLQPGATRVTEGSAVHTRGGDPAETPVYLDGGRMLAASRFEGLDGGLFGVLDPAVLRGARLLTGGFGVRFGNALSGVLDLETDGRTTARRARAGMSTVQAAATLRAPVGAARASAWASARASNAGALLRMHGRADEFSAAPWSVEATGGVVAEPRPGTELRADVLLEADASTRRVDAGGHAGAFRSTGGARLLVLAGRTVLPRAPVLLRANLAAGTRATSFDFGVLARDRREASTLARLDAEWMAHPGVTVRSGLEAGRLARRELGQVPTTSRLGDGAPSMPLPGLQTTAGQAGGYAEVAVALAPALTLETGLRADRLPGEEAVTWDPRAALAWRQGAWTARAAGGLYHQGRWRALAPVPDAGLPSQIATRASHLVLGLERDGAVRWRAEAFRKRYGRFAAAAGTPAAGAPGAVAGPPAVGGSADGVDLLVERTPWGPFAGWLGWSLLRARLDLADGRTVSAPTDVTHSLTAVGTLALPARWSLGATGRYGTGAPFTPVVGGDAGTRGLAPVHGTPLGARLPAYGRLDVRVMRGVATRAGLLTAYVEALNVLDRANVARYTYDAAYRERRPVGAFFASRTFVVGTELTLR